MSWRPKKKYMHQPTKSCFFEKNKIDRALVKLTKRRKEKTYINNIRHEKGKIKQTPMKFR
jgi:hypothetical protein